MALKLAGVDLVLLSEGALFWPDERLLVVSDLHLEKGSSYAARGQLLPPYDTAVTLNRVVALVDQFSPECVISLGDSFHDKTAEARLADDDVARIKALTSRVDWLWVEGNHDPLPPEALGGRGMHVVRIGPLVFRHEPMGEIGEIAGHLHPVAKVRASGRAVRRRCFASDGDRLVMPALGAFTGGLNVCDPAFDAVFGNGLVAYALGEGCLYTLEPKRLIPDTQGRGSSKWSL